MDPVTARALNALNRRFYTEQAGAFSESRRDPWPGWRRMPAVLRGWAGALSVLDVGCGNGRFGDFLCRSLPDARATLHYVGLDASPVLLREVRKRDLPCASTDTVPADLLEDDWGAALGSRRFALIALFGLIHHIPGEANRAALLRDLAGRLAPGGHLAFAVWRFEAFERFRAKLRPWREHNATASEPIDVSRLEPGDHLLPWGPEGAAVRYCHFVDAAESERLVAATGLAPVDQWMADGREGDLNRYFLLRMGGGPRA